MNTLSLTEIKNKIKNNKNNNNNNNNLEEMINNKELFPSLINNNINNSNEWYNNIIKKDVKDVEVDIIIKEKHINPIDKLNNKLNDLYIQYSNEIYELTNKNIYSSNEWLDIEPDDIYYL